MSSSAFSWTQICQFSCMHRARVLANPYLSQIHLYFLYTYQVKTKGGGLCERMLFKEKNPCTQKTNSSGKILENVHLHDFLRLWSDGYKMGQAFSEKLE